MHPSALSNALHFRQVYCRGRNALTLVEVGAQDVNGSLRSAFEGLGDYIGVDFVQGRGVDVVLDDPYRLPFADASVDVLLCSSVLEHSQFFWLLFVEMLRVLKPAGLLYLNAPSNGSFHRYPVDCWRFYPDSGDALVAWAHRSGYEPALLESYISDQERAEWNDCVSIFVRDASFASCYPDRILDRLQGFRNGRKAGVEGFLKFNDRTEDQERAKPVEVAAPQIQAEPDAAPAGTHPATGRIRTGVGPADGRIARWALESPVALAEQPGVVQLSGWALASQPGLPLRLVARSGHLSASWPFNVPRPDVVAHASRGTDAQSGLVCGFKRRFEVSGDLRVGFEVEGRVFWVAQLTLQAAPVGSAPQC